MDNPGEDGHAKASSFPLEVQGLVTPPLPTTPSASQAIAPKSIAAEGSLSPVSSCSSILSALEPSATTRGVTSDQDAKTSALRALAGIGRVVSKSRQTDAEALQAIKAQRAKSKAEGSGHRHSRTLSSESLFHLRDLPSSQAHTPTKTHSDARAVVGHRRSHSGIPLSNVQMNSSPTAFAFLQTNTFYDLLAGKTLAELLEMRTAIDREISKHIASLSSDNYLVTSGNGAQTPNLQTRLRHGTSLSMGAAEAILAQQAAAATLTSCPQEPYEPQYLGQLGNGMHLLGAAASQLDSPFFPSEDPLPTARLGISGYATPPSMQPSETRDSLVASPMSADMNMAQYCSTGSSTGQNSAPEFSFLDFKFRSSVR